MNQKLLNFYLLQGGRTALEQVNVKRFPSTIFGIVYQIQNMLVHVVRLRDEKDDRATSIPDTVSDLVKDLECIDWSKNIPLRQKQVAICRNFSMLLVSVLRTRGTPARTRCGFAIYFGEGYLEDHWICEYWDIQENRWIQVDAQMDDYWIKKLHLDPGFFNPLDLKRGQFLSGAQVWKLYRQGIISGDICGFSPDQKTGVYYIRGNMMRDLYALNNNEPIYDEMIPYAAKEETLDQNMLKFLDRTADAIVHCDTEFSTMQEQYHILEGKLSL